uniref:Ion transport domain-containing protein n=1 Tax=Guillardia theta TaxID=55529 RepID=A0A7S4NLP3_GUITH|mmetsp:Transcript_25543/g.84405  ORF Transcript_25543/g.84405 Transcript_25543/m.84405 type:complete len:339 (+) Transcript_25543:37-1053(+)
MRSFQVPGSPLSESSSSLEFSVERDDWQRAEGEDANVTSSSSVRAWKDSLVKILSLNQNWFDKGEEQHTEMKDLPAESATRNRRHDSSWGATAARYSGGLSKAVDGTMKDLEGGMLYLQDDGPSYMRVSSSRMTSADRWKSAASQLIYSPIAKFYYGLMILVTVVELVVTLADPHRSPHTTWFIGLELFMVAMLVNEVMIRYIAEGSPTSFFRSKSNIFDMAVALLCLFTVTFLILMPSTMNGVQEWVPLVALRIRDFLRILRLIFLFKNHRKAQLAGQSIMHLRIDETDADHLMGSSNCIFDSPSHDPLDKQAVDMSAAFGKHIASPPLSPVPPQTL